MLTRVRERSAPWDIVIIGGGATGVGCALDAASRGCDVLLLEQADFGKGTSTRSTKLIHGGIRYLKQANFSLVREALRERGILHKNASKFVREQKFIVPCYSSWQKIYYGFGLKVYDRLSGNAGFPKSRMLSRTETINAVPNIRTDNLCGGVQYSDGQFDDARLLVELVKKSAEFGSCPVNYCRVEELSKTDKGIIDGLTFECLETGEIFQVSAKIVINATGAFCDSIRRMSSTGCEELISPSQGIHLVFDGDLLNGDTALMIPKTSDGRVLFAIPWHDKTIVGTTDTPIENVTLEPAPMETEIEFILETCGEYFANSPGRQDVLSVFTGIRPLIKNANTANTAVLSRGHLIQTDSSNLLTITGGKWTTYRNMAEDAVTRALSLAKMSERNCVTDNLEIIDPKHDERIHAIITENPVFGERLDENFSFRKADVVYAVRYEMARIPEDILARRSRILFLDAKTAIRLSRAVALLMAQELDRNPEWVEKQTRRFEQTAQAYLLSP